jgi:hypothetical protein
VSEKKRYLVPVNVRYKEYHVVEVGGEDGEGNDRFAAIAKAQSGESHEIRPLREYVEAMDSGLWDDPQEIDELEYIQYLNDDAHYLEGRPGDPDDD